MSEKTDILGSMPKGHYSNIKLAVWERDDFTCSYCGVEMRDSYFAWKNAIIEFNKLPIRERLVGRKGKLKRTWGLRPTVDHVIPRSAGGETTMENLVTACSPCNSKKGSIIYDQT